MTSSGDEWQMHSRPSEVQICTPKRGNSVEDTHDTSQAPVPQWPMKSLKTLVEIRRQRKILFEQIRRVEERFKCDARRREEGTRRAVTVAIAEFFLVQAIYCSIAYIYTINDEFRKPVVNILAAMPPEFAPCLTEISRLMVATSGRSELDSLDGTLVQMYNEAVNILEKDEALLLRMKNRRTLELHLLREQVEHRLSKLQERGLGKNLVAVVPDCHVDERDGDGFVLDSHRYISSLPAVVKNEGIQRILDCLVRATHLCGQRIEWWQSIYLHERALIRCYSWLIKAGSSLSARIRNQIDKNQRQLDEILQTLENMEPQDIDGMDTEAINALMRPAALTVFDLRLEQKEYDEMLSQAQATQTRLHSFVTDSYRDHDEYAVGKLSDVMLQLFRESFFVQ